MGCGGSKAKAAEAKQPAASPSLLDPSTGKPADKFDLTNVEEIKAALAKLTPDELSALIKEWSPEVKSKVVASLAVIAKQKEEKATAADDQTTEDAKGGAAEAEATTAAETPVEYPEETPVVEKEVVEGAASSKSLCCF